MFTINLFIKSQSFRRNNLLMNLLPYILDSTNLPVKIFNFTTRKKFYSKLSLMNSHINYEQAIFHLNCLQSDESKILVENIDINKKCLNKLNKFRHQLSFLGIEQKDLKNLNIIHITGTKGKGSTCHFLESILREKKFKTGLFTSPHLISVRERIKLNGKPIHEDVFVKYFFEIYNTLNSDHYFKNDMPFYFSFLTLMAFYIFKKEKVDVSIIEVGIGGEYDCTNVINEPIATGISSVGIDHVNILGNTLEKIAWQKSGIFKRNVPAFISFKQKNEVMKIFLERMEEKECFIKICPSLDEYQLINKKLELGIDGKIQKLNASLAIQLSNYFCNKLNNNLEMYNFNKLNLDEPLFVLDKETVNGLKNCNFPGRFQHLKLENGVNFYLDGAHTVESIHLCSSWFKEKYNINKNSYNVLLFNCTGNRNVKNLLGPLLLKNHFDAFLISPIIKSIDVQNNFNLDNSKKASYKKGQIDEIENSLQEFNFLGNIQNFNCLFECLEWINKKNVERLMVNETSINVLVTGSIYLVGDLLSLLNYQNNN